MRLGGDDQTVLLRQNKKKPAIPDSEAQAVNLVMLLAVSVLTTSIRGGISGVSDRFEFADAAQSKLSRTTCLGLLELKSHICRENRTSRHLSTCKSVFDDVHVFSTWSLRTLAYSELNALTLS
jgi:hypothetical protein